MTSRFASLSVQDIENVVEERGVKNERREMLSLIPLILASP